MCLRFLLGATVQRLLKGLPAYGTTNLPSEHRTFAPVTPGLDPSRIGSNFIPLIPLPYHHYSGQPNRSYYVQHVNDIFDS